MGDPTGEAVRKLTDEELSLWLPGPDAIRAAIDRADERAKLLRRLLLVVVRLRVASGSNGGVTR